MWQRLLSTLVFIELVVFGVHSEWMLDDSGLISWSRDCDFPGGDLFKTTSKATECGKLCVYFSGCSFFAWGNGNCYFLKAGIIIFPQSSNGSRAQFAAVSMGERMDQ